MKNFIFFLLFLTLIVCFSCEKLPTPCWRCEIVVIQTVPQDDRILCNYTEEEIRQYEKDHTREGYIYVQCYKIEE